MQRSTIVALIFVSLAVIGVLWIVAVPIYKEVVNPPPAQPPPRILVFWKDQAQLPVDLSEFFNNDGISSKTDKSDTNFDCPDHPPNIPGSGYPAEALPRGGSIFDPAEADVSFLFPVIATGEYNNVACEGQRIAAGEESVWLDEDQSCTEIAVLGAAENGAASANITLEYEDGTADAVRLSFPDWCKKPKSKEPLAAVSADYRYAWNPAVRHNVKHAIRCHLYVRCLPVDGTKRLSAIVLPERRNLHIFAITLSLEPPGIEVARRADALAIRYSQVAALATEPPADLTQPVEALAQELEEAAPKIAPKLWRQFVWLKTQHEYLVHRLGDRLVRRGSATEGWAHRSAGAIRSDLAQLLQGRDPFAARRGHLLKGYVSEIDGQIQPYGVYVPREYKKGALSPLVVYMHGHGWYRPFQGIPAPRFRDAVVLSPHGRGSMDYMFVAEEDVLACIDEMKKDYRIDPDRIILLGSSMGGTGCWSLATKYPDRFTAIGPCAANADSQAWKNVAAKHPSDDGSFAWLRKQIRASLDPVTFASNLLHVPAYFLHGSRDGVVPVGNSRSMARALERAGCKFVYREGKGGHHGWRPRHFIAEQHDFVFAARRATRPRRVQLKAGYLKYGSAYWVRILRIDRSDQIGEVTAEVRTGSLIDVKTKNVGAVEFDLNRCPIDTSQAVIIVVNGRPVFTDIVPPDGRVRLGRVGSDWEPGIEMPPLYKKPYLEGPVADAFTRSFVIVIGTTAATPTDRKILREEAQRLAADWELLYTKPPRIKTDRQVTQEDIRQHNLILYGGPQDNAVVARIADQLPIVMERGAISVAGRPYKGPGVATKFCYPNPLNPERLVVVTAGAQRGRDVFQTNTLFGNWFQWGPFDNRAWFDYAVFDRKTRSAETCLEVGFFGHDWGFNSVTGWLKDGKERGRTPRRRIPAHTLPPDQKTVYLSDLVPLSIDQHKLPVGFDTSAEGRALTIGVPPRTFRRGLGVRPPSKIAFRVHTAKTPDEQRFARFKATVGIDLEGETKVPRWRDKNEWVKFLVYGDGHLLYQTGALKWNSKPVHINVPISRVKKLELQVWCSRARWLVGSAAWGNGRIVRGNGEGAD